MTVARREGGAVDGGGVEFLRAEVEALDDQLVSLLARRLELARTLGERKRSLGLPTLDPAREAEVVGRVAAAARDRGVPDEPVRSIFWTVVQICRSAQQGE
jgi:chorismate mutase